MSKQATFVLVDHGGRDRSEMCQRSGDVTTNVWDARTAGDGAQAVAECPSCRRVVNVRTFA